MNVLKIFFALFVSFSINSAFAQKAIIIDKYTADPSAHVFNGKLYVYTSHDKDNATYYDMEDWLVFSTKDLKTWTAPKVVFSLAQLNWAKNWAWAPDCVKRYGKYYFYYPVERNKIGVAVSNSPTGNFKDPIGKPLIDNQIDSNAGKEPIDPAVFIDKGQAYMYFGCRYPKVIKLNKDMVSFDGKINELVIIDSLGNKQHWKEKKHEEPSSQQYFGGDGVYGEAPWVFKRKDKYYLMYANGWAKDATLVYAMANNPLGPFVYAGKVMPPVSSITSHGSVVKFKGKWYVFYHTKDLSNNDFKRSVSVAPLFFNKNGTIML